jgi:AraC family transcriptional regulator, transcriptional activator of pobA
LWIAEGISQVSIDFETVNLHPNSIIFLNPGRVVKLKFSCAPPNGWVLGFPREFFLMQNFDGLNIKSMDIFHAYGTIPLIVLSPKIGERIHMIAEMMSELMHSQIPKKEAGISALLRTMFVYCDSRCNIKADTESNNLDLKITGKYKNLVSKHFHHIHHVSRYAEIMNVSPKYLNQVVRRIMGVTAKSIIQEQIVIQACRDLKFTNNSVKEISVRLGFAQSEHFSNFFKKSTGHPPSVFRDV